MRWAFKSVTRGSLFSMAVVSLALPVPASAQFGGLFKKKSPTSEKSASDDCTANPKKSIGRSIIGNIIGDATGSASRRLGIVGRYVPTAEVAGILTDSIACKLDPEEQRQAADATVEATRSEAAGTTVEWKSDSRDNVSGRTTVNARTAAADGSTCMNLTDVVIVEGEETRVSKRMCKGPGQEHYKLVA